MAREKKKWDLQVYLYQSPSIKEISVGEHEYDEIIVMLSGTYRAKLADTEIVAGPGDLVFFPAETRHEEENDPDDPMECYHLAFYWKNPPKGLPNLTQDRNGRIRLMADWASTAWRYPSKYGPQVRRHTLGGILAEFLRLCGSKEDELVHDITDYVLAHMGDDISLDDLARRANLSKHYFARRFKSLTGKSPMEEVRILRLETARNLIQSSNLPLKSIAARVGLSDAFTLSRLFRKHFKISPSEMRRTCVR